MRRGPKPATSKEAKPSVARKSKGGARASDLENRLVEALDRERAISEILSVISNSPTDVQPVFEAIAVSAANLCRAQSLIVFQVQSGMIMPPIAAVGASAEALAFCQSRGALPVSAEALGAQAIRERTIIHVPHALQA